MAYKLRCVRSVRCRFCETINQFFNTSRLCTTFNPQKFAVEESLYQLRYVLSSRIPRKNLPRQIMGHRRELRSHLESPEKLVVGFDLYLHMFKQTNWPITGQSKSMLTLKVMQTIANNQAWFLMITDQPRYPSKVGNQAVIGTFEWTNPSTNLDNNC